MPIKSYIVHPVPGWRNELIAALSGLPGCQVTPAENNPIVILVTDSHSESEETELEDKLQSLPYLQSLALVAGHMETDEPDE